MALSRNVAIVAPGTWEQGDGPRGLLRAVTDRLDSNFWRYYYARGPFSFGPINSQDPAAPSYNESVAEAVGSACSIYRYETDFGRRDRNVAFIGYSQGEEIIARAVAQLQSEGIAHRIKWYHGFGGPCRPKGMTFHLGNVLAFEGISDFRIPSVFGIDAFWYGFEQDMYTNANPDSFLHLGYDAFTDLQLHNPLLMAQKIFEAIQKGLLQELFLRREAGQVVVPAGLGSGLGTLTSLLSGNGGGSFGPALGLGANSGLLGRLLNGVLTPGGGMLGALATAGNPFAVANLITKTVNTVNQVNTFQQTNAHSWYADRAHPIKGTMTAADHSVNHLNYWGARL